MAIAMEVKPIFFATEEERAPHFYKDINKDIKKIRIKKRDIPVAEYEQDIEYLLNVPYSSVNKKLAHSTLKTHRENFQYVLKTQIRSLVSDKKISEAKKLLNKLKALPDSQNDVKQVLKNYIFYHIDSRELKRAI